MLGRRQSRRRRPTVTVRSAPRHDGVTTGSRPKDQRLTGAGTIACPEPTRADCPAGSDPSRVKRGVEGLRAGIGVRWLCARGKGDRGSAIAWRTQRCNAEITPGRRSRSYLPPQIDRAFALRRVDEPIPLPISSQRLIAYLALSDGPTQRSHVAGTFWPDVGQDRAMANLRSVIWRVRGSGHELIAADDGQLSLQRNVVVDARELRRTAYAILESGDGGDPTWLDAPSAPTRSCPTVPTNGCSSTGAPPPAAAHALERLCGELAATGRFGLAVEACFAVLAAELLRESAQRQLIEVYLWRATGQMPSASSRPRARHPRGGRRRAVA